MTITFPFWAYASIAALLLILIGWYLRLSKLCVVDMFTDPDGKLSQAKMWTNIAYATMTCVVWKQGAEGHLSTDMALVYLAVIGGAEIGKKALEIWKGKAS
jgi:hypothetical protein